MQNLKKLVLTSAIGIMFTTIVSAEYCEALITKRSIRCYWFEAEKLIIKNICRFQLATWTGGGAGTIRWEDGVMTSIVLGVQSSNNSVCQRVGIEASVDGFCARRFYRHSVTFKRISEEESFRLGSQNMTSLSCFEVRKGSICLD
jgi:hypothetical protein